MRLLTEANSYADNADWGEVSAKEFAFGHFGKGHICKSSTGFAP
jgi:hypothetical protein